MKMLHDYQRAECRRLLRKAAKKHPEKEIVNRMAKAAQYLDPTGDYPGPYAGTHKQSFRQGEADSPGHLVYWIQSSEDYNGRIDDHAHHAPPFYRVRLGANGDNHSCNCKDFANGAPMLNGKKYCKHILIARALEHLRDHPVKPDRKIHDAVELMALENKATMAGIDLESPAARHEMINNPQKFIDLIAEQNGLKPEMELA